MLFTPPHPPVPSPSPAPPIPPRPPPQPPRRAGPLRRRAPVEHRLPGALHVAVHARVQHQPKVVHGDGRPAVRDAGVHAVDAHVAEAHGVGAWPRLPRLPLGLPPSLRARLVPRRVHLAAGGHVGAAAAVAQLRGEGEGGGHGGRAELLVRALKRVRAAAAQARARLRAALEGSRPDANGTTASLASTACGPAAGCCCLHRCPRPRLRPPTMGP
jgi:hypothetical protein